MKKTLELSIFSDFLKKKNMPLTQPRRTISKVFLQMDGHFEAQDILEEVRKVDGLISMTTVYRTLDLLVECGLVAESNFADKSKKFEVTFGKKHHDHLVCNKCQKIEEFHHPVIESLQNSVAQSRNFAIASHRLVLFGVCRDCR